MKKTLMIIGSLLSCGSAAFADVWVEGTSQPFRRITISSPVEEIVQKVNVKEEDIVKEGDVLATLFSTREQLEVKRLGFLIDKATVDVNTARQLYSKQIQKKSSLLEKEAELRILEVEREMAQFAVDQRTIKAPSAGTIVYRLKDDGEAIGRVEPLFEIIDASKLKLVFFLPSKYIPILEENMEVEVVFPELPKITGEKARLTFTDPQLDSRSGLFRVRFEFDNEKFKLKPGLRVKVKLPGLEDSE